jgi:hypothetical protein
MRIFSWTVSKAELCARTRTESRSTLAPASVVIPVPRKFGATATNFRGRDSCTVHNEKRREAFFLLWTVSRSVGHFCVRTRRPVIVFQGKTEQVYCSCKERFPAFRQVGPYLQSILVRGFSGVSISGH